MVALPFVRSHRSFRALLPPGSGGKKCAEASGGCAPAARGAQEAAALLVDEELELDELEDPDDSDDDPDELDPLPEAALFSDAVDDSEGFDVDGRLSVL